MQKYLNTIDILRIIFKLLKKTVETYIFANSFFKSCNASLTVVCEWNKKVKKCTRRLTSLHRRLEVRGYVGRRRRRRHCSFFTPRARSKEGEGGGQKAPFLEAKGPSGKEEGKETGRPENEKNFARRGGETRVVCFPLHNNAGWVSPFVECLP